MAPSISSSKLTLTYPIFAADYLDATRLVVGGGGGEGRSGVGNKITLLDTGNPSDISQLSEHVLSRDEDSCMSLGVAQPTGPSSSPTILAGVNSSEAILSSGHNEHFRTIPIANSSTNSPEISSTVGATRRQLFTPITSKEMYQRVLRTKAGVVAIANGGGISTSKDFEIIVATSDSFSVRRTLSLSGEASDLDLDDEGETLVYSTAKEIFTASTTKKEQPKQLATPPGDGNIRAIRIVSSSPLRILVVRNRPARSGIDLYLLDADTGKIISTRAFPKSSKAATALDTTYLNSGSTLAAVAAADQSIHLFHITARGITPSKSFTDVHPHQITKVAFSKTAPPQAMSSGSSAYGDADEKDAAQEEEERKVVRLASTSIGNTVVVHTIPVSGGRVMSKSAGLTQTAVSLVAVILFAVVLQYVFLTRAGFSGLPSGSSSSPMQELLAGLREKLGGASRNAETNTGGMTLKEGWSSEGLEGFQAGMMAGEHGAPFEDLEARSLEDDLWDEAERRPVESAEDWHRRPMGDSVEEVE